MTPEIQRQIAELVNTHSPIVRKIGVEDVGENYAWTEHNGVVVACIKATKLSWYQVELTHLVVHPDYRRQGHGRELLRKAWRAARDKGLRIAQVTIRANNRPSMTLFTTEGFRLVNTITGLSGTPVGVWQKVLAATTYSAFYQDDHSCIIYKYKANDGTLENLPQKAEPANDPRSTYWRTDKGDRYEFALFRTNLGQLIVVQRD